MGNSPAAEKSHPPTRKQFVWFDCKINSKENQEIIQKSIKTMVINQFLDKNTAIYFIKNCSEPLIVITAGTDGEEFVKEIYDCYNVLYIIVFCFNVPLHLNWASNYKKIILVTQKKEELQKMMEECLEKASYIECDTNVVKEFWSVIFKLLKSFFDSDNNKDLILKELTLLNKEKTNEIATLFHEREKNILNAIIYLYSTNYIYKFFNQTLASRSYKQLLITLTTTTKEILTWEYPNHKNSKEVRYLYRGIKGNKIEVMFQFQEYINKKIKPIYFPAFTSASSDLEQAKKFSDGIIFEIILSNDAHPHIILETNSDADLIWTQYPKEKETLLFSYFPFNVEKIRDDSKYSIITLAQDEDSKVFSKEYSKMKKFWNKEIIANIEKENKVQFPENFEIIDSIMEKIDEKESFLIDNNTFDEVVAKSINEIIKEESIPIKEEVLPLKNENEEEFKADPIEFFKTSIKINLNGFWLLIDGQSKIKSENIEILDSAKFNDSNDLIKKAIKSLEKAYFCQIYLELNSSTSQIQEVINTIKKFHDLTLDGNPMQISRFLKENKHKLNETQNIQISKLGHKDFHLLELFNKEKIKKIELAFDEDEPIFMRYLEYCRQISRQIDKDKFFFRFISRPTIETFKLFTKFCQDLKYLKQLEVISNFSFPSVPSYVDHFIKMFSFLTKLEILDLRLMIYPFNESKFQQLRNSLLNLKNLKELKIDVGGNSTDLISLSTELPELITLKICDEYYLEEELKNELNTTSFKLRELHFFKLNEGIFPIKRFINLQKLTYSQKFQTQLDTHSKYFNTFFSDLKLLSELTHLKISISIVKSYDASNCIFNSINSLEKLENLELSLHIFSGDQNVKITDFGRNKSLKYLSLGFVDENIVDFCGTKHNELISFKFDSRKYDFCFNGICLQKINNFLDNCPKLNEVKISSSHGKYEIQNNRIKEKN